MRRRSLHASEPSFPFRERSYPKREGWQLLGELAGSSWTVDSLPRVVLPFGVALELLAVEIDLAEVAGGVAGCLVVEVPGGRVAAFAAGGDGAGVHAGAEFDDGYEAVAARAVPFPRS